MKHVILTLAAVFAFGVASAQTDTTKTTKATTTKKTEKVVKQKNGRDDSKVTRTNTTKSLDTINRSTNPVRKPKDVAPETENPKVKDPAKPE